MIQTRWLFALLTIFLSASCSGESQGTITTRIAEPLLVQRLPQELQDNGIWFELSNDNILTIHRKDEDRFSQLLDAIVEEYVPKERSFSPASYSQERCLVSLLKKRGVSFSIIEFSGDRWIVLGENRLNEILGTCTID